MHKCCICIAGAILCGRSAEDLDTSDNGTFRTEVAALLCTVPGSIWRSPATPKYAQTCSLVPPFALQPKRAALLLMLHLMHVCVTVVTGSCTLWGLKPFDQDLARGSDQLTGHGHVV